MVTPRLDQLLAIPIEYNTIPVYTQINADLETPVSTLLKLQQQGTSAFLLESVEGAEHRARYSFIGTDPARTLVQNGQDPLIKVQQHLDSIKYCANPNLPAFVGGYVGYIAYDCVQYYEPAVNLSQQLPNDTPESILLYCTNIVIFDHVQHVIRIVAHIDLTNPNNKLQDEYQRCCTDILHIVNKLNKPTKHAPHANMPTPAQDQLPTHDKQQFIDSVEKLKENIRAGDIIQAVPSRVRI
jgi:anthranilate synthase component 1